MSSCGKLGYHVSGIRCMAHRYFNNENTEMWKPGHSRRMKGKIGGNAKKHWKDKMRKERRKYI
jgi:hypothetical protein